MAHDPPRVPKFRRLKKAAATLLVYALLGFVTTWATTWALAAWMPMRGSLHTSYEDIAPQLSELSAVRMETDHARAFGALRRYWHTARKEIDLGTSYRYLGTGLANDVPTRRAARVDFLWTWPLGGDASWGHMFDCENQTPEEIVRPSGMEDARGWPALCGWYTIAGSGIHNGGGFGSRFGAPTSCELSVEGAIVLPPHEGILNTATLRALPYLPIWSGLAFNTTFYGLIWFALIRIPRAFRQHRRFSRGLCPRCAYDREGDLRSPCPECGWMLRRTAERG